MCRAQERLDIDLAQLSWPTNSSYISYHIQDILIAEILGLAFFFRGKFVPGFFFRDLKLSFEIGEGDMFKCQHSSSLVSSIKKRIFQFFGRVSLLPQPRFEPGTFGT